jgi:transposase
MNHSTNIEPRTVDYDQTLVLAIELSNKSWVLVPTI